MEFALLTKRYKGIFVSLNKSTHSFYVYFHFPEKTFRIFFSNNKFGYDSYSSINFNKIIKLESNNG